MVNQQNQPASDEIDIGQLFQKIWFRKYFILSFTFVTVLLVAAWLSMGYIAKPPVKEYARVIQLNFPGAAENLYPSGQRYSASDILAPKVLSEVYRINDIKSHEISERQFLESFSVSPYASNIEFINKKFDTLLTNKKLTRPEIENLEKEYLKQLDDARSKLIKVSYVNTSLFPLETALINKVLIDIPKVWSQLAIEELGVLNLKVTAGEYYNEENSQRFEYVKMLNYIKKGGEDLADSLQTLTNDEVGGAIRNSKSGLSAVDVQERLENLVVFEIEPLFSTVTNLGIVKSKFKAKLYLQNSIQELSDRKIMLQEKKKNYQSVLDAYVKRFSSNNSVRSGQVSNDTSTYTQLDGTFFDKITTMIEEQGDTQYKQKLLDEQLKIMEKIESINGRLVKFQRAMDNLDSKDELAQIDLKKEYINEIDIVNDKLVGLIAEYKELLALRNQQVLGKRSALYQLVDSNVSIKSGLKSFIKQMILFSILAAIIAVMIATVLSLLKRLPEQEVAQEAHQS